MAVKSCDFSLYLSTDENLQYGLLVDIFLHNGENSLCIFYNSFYRESIVWNMIYKYSICTCILYFCLEWHVTILKIGCLNGRKSWISPWQSNLLKMGYCLFFICGYNLFINTDLVYRVVNMPTCFLYPFQYGMFSNSILANLFDVGQMIQ